MYLCWYSPFFVNPNMFVFIFKKKIKSNNKILSFFIIINEAPKLPYYDTYNLHTFKAVISKNKYISLHVECNNMCNSIVVPNISPNDCIPTNISQFLDNPTILIFAFVKKI